MPNKTEEKEEKKPKFEEIAKGKVYNVQFPDRNFTWIDFRSEEEKKIEFKLKDFGGGYSKGGKFDQLVLVSDEYFKGATPFEVWTEVERIKRTVTEASGSMNVAVASNSFISPDMARCKECDTPLFLVGEGFNCPKCGKPTV